MSTRLLILLFIMLVTLLLSFLFSEKHAFIIGLLVLSSLLLLVILKLYDNYKISKRKIIFSSFSEIEELGCFTDTQPLFKVADKRVEHAVLLIHGFSASVNEFKLLSEKLKENKIPFYAPMLTGFGLDEYHLLKNIKPKDWLRDVVNAYDLLHNFADKVSVVGHSMGGLLALYIASSKKVNKLILTAPYLIHKRSHSLMKYLLRWNLFKEFMLTLNPVINKFSRNHYNKLYKSDEIQLHRFAIPTFPLTSVTALWDIQELLNYEKLKTEKPLILFGKKDTTILSSNVYRLLKYHSVEYTSIEFANSGHNLLEDLEKDKVVDVILEELMG